MPLWQPIKICEIFYGMSFYVPEFPLFLSVFRGSHESEFLLQSVWGSVLCHCWEYSHNHHLGFLFAINHATN